jgi:predicted nucleic acid-binding Zn ribbon protein
MSEKSEKKPDLARQMYKLWRIQIRKSQNVEGSENRERVEDPLKLNSILNEIVTKRDWKQGIAEGSLFTEWQSVVGPELAAHSTPLSLVDGLLTIQTTSTAWAVQLNAMKATLVKTISESAPGALVEELAILGPNAPSWKKGIRTIKGARGPRDTYN